MKFIRIVLLIGNGFWLPDFVVGNAWLLYRLATDLTAHDQIFDSSLLAVAIPTVLGSFTLFGSIAYMVLFPPRAQDEKGASASQSMRVIRIVLLIGNGFMLLANVTAVPLSVFLLAKREGVEWPFDTTAWAVLLPGAISPVGHIFILAGNIAYIWRERPHVHAHNEKGASASDAPTPR